MIISQHGGITSESDALQDGINTERIEVLFTANNTGAGIVPGTSVMIESTANTNGRLVEFTLDVNSTERLVGVYEGKGGTGAEAAAANASSPRQPTGRAALLGDVIFVTTYGVAFCLQTATTAVGEPLGCSTTDGALVGSLTALADGIFSPAICLEAVTTSNSFGAVFLRCM